MPRYNSSKRKTQVVEVCIDPDMNQQQASFPGQSRAHLNHPTTRNGYRQQTHTQAETARPETTTTPVAAPSVPSASKASSSFVPRSYDAKQPAKTLSLTALTDKERMRQMEEFDCAIRASIQEEMDYARYMFEMTRAIKYSRQTAEMEQLKQLTKDEEGVHQEHLSLTSVQDPKQRDNECKITTRVHDIPFELLQIEIPEDRRVIVDGTELQKMLREFDSHVAHVSMQDESRHVAKYAEKIVMTEFKKKEPVMDGKITALDFIVGRGRKEPVGYGNAYIPLNPIFYDKLVITIYPDSKMDAHIVKPLNEVDFNFFGITDVQDKDRRMVVNIYFDMASNKFGNICDLSILKDVVIHIGRRCQFFAPLRPWDKTIPQAILDALPRDMFKVYLVEGEYPLYDWSKPELKKLTAFPYVTRKFSDYVNPNMYIQIDAFPDLYNAGVMLF